MYYGRIGAEGYIGYLEDERRANKIKRQLDQDPDKLSKVIMLTNGYIAAKEHFYKQQRPWESMYALGQEMVNVFGPKQIGSVLILSNLNPFNPETSVLDTRLTKGFIVEDTALKDDPVTIFASLGENEVLLPSWSRAWDAAIFMVESPDGGGGDNVDVPPAPGPGVGKQITEEAFVSAAMLGNDQIKNARAVGGIDMNAQHLDLAIKRDTKGMPLAADHQNWAQLSIQGVEPRIKQIESVHLLELIGSEE